MFIALFKFHVCYHDGFCVCMNDSVHLLYTSACGEATCNEFDSLCGFLFYHLYYHGGCQYVKCTKQILIAVC